MDTRLDGPSDVFTDVRMFGRTMWKQYTLPQTQFAGSIITETN